MWAYSDAICSRYSLLMECRIDLPGSICVAHLYFSTNMGQYYRHCHGYLYTILQCPVEDSNAKEKAGLRC
jgi:hypothetical protein